MPLIRLAEKPDLPGMVAILNWSVRELAANFQTNEWTVAELESVWRQRREWFPYLVATDDAAEAVGLAYAAPWKPKQAYRWTVETTVYVLPEAQGSGLGRALYERLFDILERQGYRRAVAGVVPPNEGSVRLHERMGMRHVGTLQRVGFKFGRWLDVGYWAIEWDGDAPPGEIRPIAAVDGADAPVRVD